MHVSPKYEYSLEFIHVTKCLLKLTCHLIKHFESTFSSENLIVYVKQTKNSMNVSNECATIDVCLVFLLTKYYLFMVIYKINMFIYGF